VLSGIGIALIVFVYRIDKHCSSISRWFVYQDRFYSTVL